MNAITIENVSFSYGTNRVLNDICAEIKYNQIYALLGPSGGGKTCLLRLILGSIRPQNGSISVMGDEPRVGRHNGLAISYMPQDNALCPHFTVNQTLNYFKNIYRLSDEEFKKGCKKLKNLLKLPSGQQLVRQLSGGTQRRLSIAIALINRPTIVILDEPTVGIDPLLRQDIWHYLMSECKHSLTAIIVTHYVEEAVNANRVALMRNGRILAEESPKRLMRLFRTNSLENVFLCLCLAEDRDLRANGNVNTFYKNRVNNKDINTFDNNSYDSSIDDSLVTSLSLKLSILVILLHKNILKFFHLNIWLIILLMPAFQALLLCAIYSKDLILLNTGVVNEEVYPKHSATLLNSIKSNNRHIINPINYSSLEKAIDGVKHLETIAVIRIPRHFSRAINERLSRGLIVSNETIVDSNVRLYVDNSVLMYANGVIDSLANTFVSFFKKLYAQKNRRFNGVAISVEKTANSKDIYIHNYYMPGNYLFFQYISIITISSLALTHERRDGLFERSLIAGVGHELVFASHLITNCLVTAVQILFLYISGFMLFSNVVNNSSVLMITSYLMLQSVSGIALGLLISSLVDRDIVCIIIVWFITIPQLFCSGLFWPLESLPDNLRLFFYYLSTLSIPVDTFRHIVLRGWDLNHPYIRFSYLYSLTFIAICLTISLIVFKR